MIDDAIMTAVHMRQSERPNQDGGITESRQKNRLNMRLADPSHSVCR